MGLETSNSLELSERISILQYLIFQQTLLYQQVYAGLEQISQSIERLRQEIARLDEEEKKILSSDKWLAKAWCKLFELPALQDKKKSLENDLIFQQNQIKEWGLEKNLNQHYNRLLDLIESYEYEKKQKSQNYTAMTAFTLGPSARP